MMLYSGLRAPPQRNCTRYFALLFPMLPSVEKPRPLNSRRPSKSVKRGVKGLAAKGSAHVLFQSAAKGLTIAFRWAPKA